MNVILTLLALASLVMLIIGLINPKKAVPFNLPKTRGIAALIYVGLFLLFCIIIGATTSDDVMPSQATNQQEQPLEQSSASQDKVQTTSQEAQQTQSKNEIEETTIGKTFQVGHFEYTINGVRFRKTIGDSFYSETADGIYMLVDLTIKNISKETRMLDGSMFIVTDMEDTRYEHSSDGVMILDNDLFLKSCQPKIPTKGVLLFEVPEKGAYYIYLAGNAWGTKTTRVLLK